MQHKTPKNDLNLKLKELLIITEHNYLTIIAVLTRRHLWECISPPSEV